MKTIIGAVAIVALLATTCRTVTCQAQVSISDFDEIKLFTLTNASGNTVKITNYGAIVTSIIVPDRDGNKADIALGYNRVEDYINAVNKPYFGAIVGRYGNRIARGQFTLDGQAYSLAINNPPNHLHGGMLGFDKVVWDSKPVVGSGWTGVELDYLAKDQEEGYPGNLQIKVIYKWSDNNQLTVDYLATTDKATPVNLTQHTYFNLKGEGEGDILGHELSLNASHYTPVDQTLIPTGVIAAVAGTPFDFTSAKAIGRDIGQENEQLKFGLGYDHNWVLNRGAPPNEPGTVNEAGTVNEPVTVNEPGKLISAAVVYEPSVGRVLEIETTEPGIQFYCGNFLDGRLQGKAGKPYVHRGGFCLETQHFPDSPNHENFPSTILKPGDEYKSTTVLKFSTK